jgi:hypothetical protein
MIPVAEVTQTSHTSEGQHDNIISIKGALSKAALIPDFEDHRLYVRRHPLADGINFRTTDTDPFPPGPYNFLPLLINTPTTSDLHLEIDVKGIVIAPSPTNLGKYERVTWYEVNICDTTCEDVVSL